MNQLLVIHSGEKKSARVRVLEFRQQHIGQLPRELQIAAAPAGLQQLEQGVGKKRVVIEIGRQMRAAVLIGRQQSAVAPQPAVHEVNGGDRRIGQIGPVEHPCRYCERFDHESVRRNRLGGVSRNDTVLRQYGARCRLHPQPAAVFILFRRDAAHRGSGITIDQSIAPRQHARLAATLRRRTNLKL